MTERQENQSPAIPAEALSKGCELPADAGVNVQPNVGRFSNPAERQNLINDAMWEARRGTHDHHRVVVDRTGHGVRIGTAIVPQRHALYPNSIVSPALSKAGCALSAAKIFEEPLRPLASRNHSRQARTAMKMLSVPTVVIPPPAPSGASERSSAISESKGFISSYLRPLAGNERRDVDMVIS